MYTTNSMNDRLVNNNHVMPDAPFHLDAILKPPTQPIKQNMKCKQNLQDINPNINFDFEENSPFQEGFMLETFQRPENHSFKIPKN